MIENLMTWGVGKWLVIFYAAGIFSVIAVSVILYFLCLRRYARRPVPLNEGYYSRRLTSILYFFAVFSCYIVFSQILKFRSLHFYADFGHFMQLFYSMASTGKPLCLSHQYLARGTANYLSVHFIPLIYFFVPFFKVWPRGETIFILGYFLVLSSAIPLYKLAALQKRDKQFPLFMAVLLLWYPTFQYTALYEFEMLRFSVPLILWMLYFWEKRNAAFYFLFAILAILIREDVGLTIMMFGMYALIFTKRRKEGVFTVLLGMTAFIVITEMIMPALRKTDQCGYVHVGVASFSAFGSTTGEILLNILKHPGMVLLTVLQPIKLANIFMFFLPLLFIPFLAPAVLVSTLANFGVGMLSGGITHSSYMLYYLSPSVAFIFYAFMKGWPKLIKLLEVPAKKHLSITRNAGACINSAAMAAVFLGLLVSNIFFGPSPISLQFWFKNLRPASFNTQNFHYSVYKVTDHHRKAKEFCDLIPDSAFVSAPQFLHSLLFRKTAFIVYPYVTCHDKRQKMDYVIFDKTNNGLGENSPAYNTQSDFDVVEKDKKTWKLIKSEDGYFLYKRVRY